jgi:hypothetical protein
MSTAPRILFLTAAASDYLADTLLHGLRSICGSRLVDFPKHDLMYQSCPSDQATRLHGKGFTLYRLLDDEPIDRTQIAPRFFQGDFDLVVLSNIWLSFGVLVDWWPEFLRTRTVVLDGADSPQLYPYAGRWWRNCRRWFLPRAHSRFLYFKREWTPATHQSRTFNLLPSRMAEALVPLPNLRPISFGIPEDKIVGRPQPKTKLLAQHVVDDEVAALMGGSVKAPFATEAEYFADLRASKFAITTKRSGWDCLRHYEIAANGCVPCFRRLDEKPARCAPHGLKPGVNCISYRDGKDLTVQLSAIQENDYQGLLREALTWARAHSTVAIAKRFLASCGYAS